MQRSAFSALFGLLARPRSVGAAAWAGWALVCCLAAGCGGGAEPAPKAGPGEDEPAVRILVLDDHPLAESIERIWRERGEGDINVLEKTSQEVLDSPRRVLDADLVVYPAGLIGELAERDLLQPLDEETRQDANLSLADFFPPVRLRVMSWNRQVMASALGAPDLMLVYRRDVLAKVGAKPPQTWREYHALAKQLDDRETLGDLAGETWAGACEPGGQWLALTLLARGACYLGDSFDVSQLWEFRPMTARLHRAEFQRALEGMAAATVDRSASTPQQCFQAVAAGRCAMALCWPSGAALSGELPSPALQLGCAPLPGAGEVRSGDGWLPRPPDDPSRMPLVAAEGRLVSITREALRRKSAAHRLIWLTGKEWNSLVSPASSATMPCRISAKELSLWTGPALDDTARRQLADVLKPMSERRRSLPAVRIPGRDRYLKALSDAVQQTLDGKDAAESLQQASAAWDEITAELGLEKQREALGHSHQ